jgi:4-phosphopantoate--beta-alanine ligase
MTRLSPRHPRYRSLRTRAHLARDTAAGVVVPEGLIAHGRGEAFDYLLGERTSPSARRAIRAAAEWLRAARLPVLSVNGNVASLAAPHVARLQRALPSLRVEINLFHRSPARARSIAARLSAAGVRDVLGVRPGVRIAGLPSDRAWVDRRGIAIADVCLIPLEDGDRAEALRARGCRVISIDLNPLSRTSRVADLPIVDELTRALEALARALKDAARRPKTAGRFRAVDRRGLLDAARATIAAGLRRRSAARPRRPAGPRGAPARAARRRT